MSHKLLSPFSSWSQTLQGLLKTDSSLDIGGLNDVLYWKFTREGLVDSEPLCSYVVNYHLCSRWISGRGEVTGRMSEEIRRRENRPW